MAIGEYSGDTGGYEQPLIETLEGGAWTATEAPLPANASGQTGYLNALACPAVGSCVAVGSYGAESLIETLSGGAWTATEAPLSGNAVLSLFGSELNTVACPAVGSCVATGYYPDTGASFSSLGVIETLSGGAWTATEVELPGNAYGPDPAIALSTVACPAVGFCVITGHYVDGTGDQRALLETLTGGNWTATEAPLPANADTTYQDSALNDVTCPATGSCVAAGYYNVPAYRAGLVETLSGGIWNPTETPVPTNAPRGGPLNVITCPAEGFCVAVGSYSGGALIETLAGGNWTPTGAPLPANATSVGALDSVACPAVGSCVAIGYYQDTSSNNQGLMESLSGGSWSATEAPLPPNGAEIYGLNTVACPAVGSCVAVGNYYEGTSGNGLIETQSGGTTAPGLIVAFGDSVAAGEGDPPPSGFTPSASDPAYKGYNSKRQWTDSADAYPAVLATDLGWSVDNFAISGACAGPDDAQNDLPNCKSGPSSVLKEILAAKKLGVHPSLITLTVGADDVNFKNCFESLVGLQSGHCSINSKGLALLEANLSSVFGLIHKDFPGVPVIFTEYYNPLPSALPSTNPDSICYDTKLAYVLDQWKLKHYREAVQTLVSGDVGGAAQTYFNNAINNAEALESELNNTLGAAAAAALIEDMGVTTVSLNFAQPVAHDMCQDYSGGNGGWVFAPGVTLSGEFLGQPVNINIVPTDSCAVAEKSGCEVVPLNKTNAAYSVTGSLQVNDIPHPTIAGQTAIANQLLPTAIGLTNSG